MRCSIISILVFQRHSPTLTPEQNEEVQKFLLEGQEIMREELRNVEPNEKHRTWEEFLQHPSEWGTTGSPGRLDMSKKEDSSLLQRCSDEQFVECMGSNLFGWARLEP